MQCHAISVWVVFYFLYLFGVPQHPNEAYNFFLAGGVPSCIKSRFWYYEMRANEFVLTSPGLVIHYRLKLAKLSHFL